MEEYIVSLLCPEHIREASYQWYASGEAILLDEVTNFVFEFPSLKGRRILRLSHSSHHSQDEVIAELDWLSYLIQNDVPASKPLLSRNGSLTERYPVEDSYFVATAFEYAPGGFVNWDDPQHWDWSLIQAMGRIMGKLHRLTKSYNPAHLLIKRPHWYEDVVVAHASDYLPNEQRQVAVEIETILDRFGRNLPTVDSYGLVHCDLNPTNFHVENGQISLFDFDDCAYNWFINDIAVAMPLYSDLFEKGGWEDKITRFFNQFMRGYEAENQLDVLWLEFIPDSLRLQNLITLVACHKSNVPNSQYHSFYELVLKTYREGHPLFEFDFYKAYKYFCTNTLH